MNPVLHGLDLNDLIYGSPNMDQVEKINKKGKALKAFLEDPDAQKHFLNTPPPKNVSPEMRKELEDLKYRTEHITPQDREFGQKCEDSIINVWIEFLYNNGISVPKSWFHDVEHHTDGLLYYIKYHYNRPRPFQIGCYYKLDIYRPIYTDANCAAYPSGHAFLATLFYKILGDKYPHAKEKMNKFHKKIMESRLACGVHYASDVKFGEELANWVYSKQLF